MCNDFKCIVDGCNRSFSSKVGRGKHLSQGHRKNEMKNALINDIISTADTLNSVPRSQDVTSSHDTYRRHFGSWNNALRIAGYSPPNSTDIEKSELIESLKDLHNKVDGAPGKRDMDTMGRYSSDTYKRKFGSWNNALEAAEMKPNLRKDIKKSELIEEIRYLHKKYGGTPSMGDIKRESDFCENVFYSMFGSWNNAVREAGFRPNVLHDRDSKRIYYGPNWVDQRQKIIVRDNKECKVTGEKEFEVNNRKLQVHHITPAREFGAHDPDVDTDYEEMNHPSNLITLSPSIHGRVEGKFTDCDPDEFARRAREMLDISIDSNKQLSKVACD